MIMPAGQPLLLPVKPWFIGLSLVLALLLEMMLGMGLSGRAAWAPSLLAVVLLFWVVHEPRRLGIGACFAFGIALDVHQGALLGQHALAYTVLGFGAIAMHRRLLWFAVPQQAIQVLPLFVAANVLQWLVRMAAGDPFPGIANFLSPVIEALLWPVVTVLLLAPQRRAPDPDDNRPI